MRVSLFVLLALALPPLASAAPPPVATFTNYPKYESATISPRGTYLAITRRDDEHEILTVVTVPSLKLSGQAHFGDLTDIELVEWANENRLLVQPTRRFPGYTADKVPTGEIIGIDADGKNADLLFGFAAGERQTGILSRGLTSG